MYYQEYIRDKSVQPHILTVHGIFLKSRSNTSRVGMVTILLVLCYAWILAMSSELVSRSRIWICYSECVGPNYTLWWSWEMAETILEEWSALHIIRMPKEEQGRICHTPSLLLSFEWRCVLYHFFNSWMLNQWRSGSMQRRKYCSWQQVKLLVSHWTCAMNWKCMQQRRNQLSLLTVFNVCVVLWTFPLL